MSLVLLRRVPIANVAPATGFTVFVDMYDTVARRPYRDAVQATTNTGANAPFELAVGALVPGASFCVGGTQRQVKYAGAGKVSTRDVPGAPACASSLAGLVVIPTYCTTLTSDDAILRASWSGGAGPLRARCTLLAPALSGAADYYAELQLPAGSTAVQFPPPGAAAVPADTRARRMSTPPPVAGGLAPGRYRLEVLEETGGILATEVLVTASQFADTVDLFIRQNAQGTYDGITYTGNNRYDVLQDGPLAVWTRHTTLLNNGPALELLRLYIQTDLTRYALLSCRIFPQPNDGARLIGTFLEKTTGAVLRGEVNFLNAPKVSQVVETGFYAVPIGTPVALLGGAPTTYSNGQGGVSRVADTSRTASRLELANLIEFHPDRPTEATGGVVVEVHSFENRDPATFGPRFTLLDSAGTELATNATGRFGRLAAGAYTVRVQVFTTVLTVPVLLQARYGLKWRLRFADVRLGNPCRLELWARGYTGPVLEVEGSDNPVTIETEGLAGGNTQADLPAVIGSSMTLRLKTRPGALADLMADDRAGRADFYYCDELHFTGYVQPDIYEEALLGGKVHVELTATDGLAALRDIDFAGHVGQPLRGRRPVLHTLLHCLSRTDLALPLGIFTNRRALEMSSDEQPETDLFTDRQAYLDNDKPMDQRAVLEALATLLGGTLVQRGGQWQLRSALEAAQDVAGRVYDAAGGLLATPTLASPAARLTPERVAKLDQGPANPLYWVDAGQHRQRRAGWRYLTASGDATFATNALPQGAYFSDASAWDASATALLTTSGWVHGERGPLPATAFPLQLVEAGSGAQELATSWPLATSGTDGRYLESELAPLAAGAEGLPAEITVEAKFYAGRPLSNDADVLSRFEARLWVEIVALPASGSGLATTGAVLRFPVVASFADGFTTAKARLALPVLPGASAVRVRVHAFTYYSPLRARDGENPPLLLVKSVGLQVLPQGATWQAADAYLASGAGGSVRPAELSVFHVDAPQRAGLFGGVAHAFRRSVTRGPQDNPATEWARADDLQPAPLLAAAVLDTLALRANPSQVLGGTVKHTRRPPEALDAVDTPYDVNGRRFCVGARTWDVKPRRTAVSLVEIGAGEFLTVPVANIPQPFALLDGTENGLYRVVLIEDGLELIDL